MPRIEAPTVTISEAAQQLGLSATRWRVDQAIRRAGIRPCRTVGRTNLFPIDMINTVARSLHIPIPDIQARGEGHVR
jgi:hypothetical protein